MFNILLIYIKILLKKPLIFLLKIIVYTEAILLTPFLIIRFNKIWNNKIIFPFYHHSFGHTILGIDCIARLFFPEKITLIIIPHKNTNKYLINTFIKSYDIFYFNFLINFETIINSSTLRFQVLKFYLNLILSFRSGFELINSFERYYGILSKTPVPCEAGVESIDKKLPYTNLSGYGRLLEEKIGLNPILPSYDLNYCKKIILDKYPNFFDKPFVTLLLRSKENSSSDFSNSIRNTNQAEYVKAVEYATLNGYHVVSSGETNSNLFKSINGFFDLTQLDIPVQLLNIYLITNCKYFVGQQSGPFALANSCGINCLLIDCWPYRLGSYLEGDINLYKKIYNDKNEEIKIQNLYLHHQDLCLGYGYKRKKMKVVDNNEQEILLSFVEFLNNNKNTEIINLQKFINLIPDNMPVKYAPSRPPSFILQQLSSI
jgi:putative glycosyltransferase (TIGR04372 family)